MWQEDSKEKLHVVARERGGGDSGSWTEGAFGDVLRGKYFGGFRGLERRILRYFEVVLFG